MELWWSAMIQQNGIGQSKERPDWPGALVLSLQDYF